MCQGSRAVEDTVDAQQGETLNIGKVVVHLMGGGKEIGALHAPGSTASQCVHCVKTDQKLTLSGIPADVQKRLGIRETAVATFTEHTVHTGDDTLTFENGRKVTLTSLVDLGIAVYVGVKHDIGSAVESMLANAIAGASQRENGSEDTIIGDAYAGNFAGAMRSELATDPAG